MAATGPSDRPRNHAQKRPRKTTEKPPPGIRADPWERRDDETDQSWQAFVTFRDLGLERSLGKVAEALSKSKPLMQRWSIRHSWMIRAHAWDREVDRLWRLELRVAQRKAASRTMATAGAAMQVAGAGLAQIAADPSKLKAQDVARLMEVASRLEQLVYGIPDRHEVAVGGGSPVSRDHVQHLTDEDRRTRMLQLRRELDSRLGDEVSA